MAFAASEAEPNRDADERLGVVTFSHATGAETIFPELPNRDGRGGMLLTESHFSGGRGFEEGSPLLDATPEEVGELEGSQIEISDGSIDCVKTA